MVQTQSLEVISVASHPQHLAVFQEPRGGDVVYVIDQTNSVLRLIDGVTLEAIEDNIPVGDMPTAVAISPDLTKIYVVNGGSANISVLEF